MQKAPPSGQWLQQTKAQYSATLKKIKQDCLLEVAGPLFQLNKTLDGFFPRSFCTPLFFPQIPSELSISIFF